MPSKSLTYLLIALSFLLQLSCSAPRVVSIGLSEQPTATEVFAAEELSRFLGRIYPTEHFIVQTDNTERGKKIYLRTIHSANDLNREIDLAEIPIPGAFSVVKNGEYASIAGHDGLGLCRTDIFLAPLREDPRFAEIEKLIGEVPELDLKKIN